MKKYFILTTCTLQALFCFAQQPVAVRNEPRHHNVFQNDFVRILDVHIPPGDTSEFHKHETPSVFIVLAPAKTGSEVITEEKKATVLARDASVSFEGFYVTPRIHRVWNEDTSEFHVMDIELLNKNQQPLAPSIQQPGFKLLFDEKPVRTYRLTLGAGENIRLPKQTSFLIVGLTDATQAVSVNGKAFSKKGDFLFIPAGETVDFISKAKQPFSLAVMEIK